MLNLWAVQQAKGEGCKAEWTCALCGRQPSSSVPSMTTVSGSRAEHLPFASLRHLVCSVPPNSRLAQIVRWLQDSDHAPMLVFDEVRCRREGLAGCMQLQWSGKGGCIAPGWWPEDWRSWPVVVVGSATTFHALPCSATRPRTCCPPAVRSPRRPLELWSRSRQAAAECRSPAARLPTAVPCARKNELVITSNVLLECLCMCVCVSLCRSCCLMPRCSTRQQPVPRSPATLPT